MYMSERTAGVIFLTLGIGALVLHAWIVTVLWAWFIVPTFHIAPIGIASAYGLALFVLLFRYTPDPPNSNIEKLRGLLKSLGFTLVVLVFGWVGHLFM